MSQSPSPKPVLFVGIDWADEEHVAWLISENRSSKKSESFQQDPEDIERWVESLRKRCPGHRICIALEQSRGPLFVGLAAFDDLELYPINPKQLSRYRESLYPSGRKSDPIDAELLTSFLKLNHEKLRRWHPNDVLTRQIAEASELRRKMVDDRTTLVLKLQATLKLYFPQAIKLIPRPLQHDLMLDLLSRWPTLQELKRAKPTTFRSFLREHGIRNQDQQTKIIDDMRAAKPLTCDKAVLGPRALYTQTLVRQLRELSKGIADIAQQLNQLVESHADEATYRSLPGAGDALVPRLIAAFDSDQERYQSAQELQCYSGIAPITKASGKTRHVDKRIQCPKFLRQTFHEYADHARKWSAWSRAFYQMKREQGQKHHAALRCLAYKWIRIIFRMWKDGTTYSEEAYIKRLKQSGSPVVKFLEN
jgi:transposase